MTLVLSGDSLTIEDVVRVARAGETVQLAPAAARRMAAARGVVERTLADGVEAYGVTTGVGVRKSFRVADDAHDALLLRQHLIGQGPPLPADVVRAAALRLANALAQGLSGARPELAERVEEHPGIVGGERGVAGGERVLVQEGDALARGGRVVAEEPDGEVGGLREVGLPDGAERANGGQDVVVQRLHDALGELGTCSGEPLCEGVREP